MDRRVSLETLLGENYFRIQGITYWKDLGYLGRVNLNRIVQLAQENLLSLMTEAATKEELRTMRDAIEEIMELLPGTSNKPVLTRLRIESFHLHDKVKIYLGDSLGIKDRYDWITATITGICKAYRAEWVDGTPNSGYYWRVTATPTISTGYQDSSLSFSTTEPRVLGEEEYNYLRQAVVEDPQFLAIFCQNAKRDWLPLWCLEKKIDCNSKAMDLQRWIIAGLCQ